MECIFMGQIVGSCSRISEEDGKRCASIYFHDTESNACSKLSHYNKTYSLVLSDDVITTNDELLKLRDRVAELEEELMEIKTARTLREAYIAGVEKGCESLREDRDYWKRRWNSVIIDVSKTLSTNGVEFTVKEIDGDKWNVGIDIPELNEAKAKVADLEKKLAAAKSNETFWRDRKEEEEDYHHYWLHTFDRAVKKAAEKGIHIGVCGTDEDCNAGVVVVDNMKAEDLEKQVVQMEDANQKLRQRISADDEEIEKLKNREGIAYWRNTYYSAVGKAKEEGVTIVIQGMDLDANVAHLKVVNHRTANLERRIKRLEDDIVAAKDRGDYWKRNYEELTEYWDNTYKDIVAAGKKVGVKIDLEGRKPDGNTGTVYVTNVAALELMVKVSDKKHEYNKKWQAMLDALKAKGVEVIYMGEEDEKPCVDVKIPEIDILKKELEALKSRTLDNVEIRLSCGDIVWTYCDGFVHVSSGISGMISADEITTGHINCLCKNHVAVDSESISCGTVPKCSSCAHYMHNAKYAHDWCYKAVYKEGPKFIRKLSKEEAEGPACADFKARKE